MNNEVFRERGDDIDDLSRRLLLSLAGIHAHSLENLPANTVLVARRIDGIPRLLRTGIKSLSVAAALVPDVKNAVRNSSL